MRHFPTPLDNIPLWIKLGVVVIMLVGGVYLLKHDPLVPHPEHAAEIQPLPPTISTAEQNPDTDSPATEPRVRPTRVRSVPTPASIEEQKRTQHYLELARQSVQTSASAQTTVPVDTSWRIWVTRDRNNQLPVIMVTLPLERNATQSNEAFVQAAKETLLQVINTLTQEDPAITRIGAVGTFPNAEGKTLPAVSLIIHRTEGQEWAPITPVDLEQFVYTLYVRPEFTSDR